MNTEITVLNLEKNKEKEFNLPFDINDIEEFLDYGNSEYKITNVEDNYNFLMEIEAYEYTYTQINELVELIENSSDRKETINKLSYHWDMNDNNIKYMIDNFEEILDKYEIFENYSTPEEWALRNYEYYNLIDINDLDSFYRNFDSDLVKAYFRDLTATYDLRDWEEKIYEVSFKEAFDFLKDNNLLFGPSLSIIGYLDWERIVRDLRAGAFCIDKYKNFIIVYNG